MTISHILLFFFIPDACFAQESAALKMNRRLDGVKIFRAVTARHSLPPILNPGSLDSLPLNRRRRLAADVVHDAVDALALR